MTSKKVIAVVAGSGALPRRIIRKLQDLKSDFVVVSIKGFGPSEFPGFEIGQIGEILEYLKTRNVTDVVFCGGVKRPSIFSLNLDSVGKRWLRRLGVRAFLGDDALLKGVKLLLSEEGLRTMSPQDIIGTLLTPEGVLTEIKPSDMDLKDIARGIFVLNTISKADVGQAVIVQEGIVLAVEAAEGTKQLIERAEGLKLSADAGGVLVKTAKIGQDQSIDLPTIGPHTISEIKKANLAGIAMGANVSQIIDFETTIQLANQNGVFVIGV